MGAVAPHRLLAGRGAVAGQEPFDEPRGDPPQAEHGRHRRGVVLAVAAAGDDEAIGDAAPAALDVGDVRVVGEVGRVPEEPLDRAREVVGVLGLALLLDPLEEQARLRPHRSGQQAGVERQDRRGVCVAGRAQAVGRQAVRVGRVDVRHERRHGVRPGSVRRGDRGEEPVRRDLLGGRLPGGDGRLGRGRRVHGRVHEGQARRPIQGGRPVGAHDQPGRRLGRGDLDGDLPPAGGRVERVAGRSEDRSVRAQARLPRVRPGPAVPVELVVRGRTPGEVLLRRHLRGEDQGVVGDPGAGDRGALAEDDPADPGPRPPAREEPG